MDRKRVLFLCTGNTSRSQMAEAILRERAGDRFEAHSAGVRPSSIRPETLQVLLEAGIPIDGLWSKGVDDFLGTVFLHYLITVCDEAEEKCPRVWPQGGTRLFWPVADPGCVTGSEDDVLKAYRRARDEISVRIDEWLATGP